MEPLYEGSQRTKVRGQGREKGRRRASTGTLAARAWTNAVRWLVSTL